MVQLIVGEKGKGKTKQLLDKVNAQVKLVSGNIVYLDKSTKHMYELNNKVRLIDVSQYMIENSSEFVGFVSGILSQDHDLEQLYFDSFLKIANLEGSDRIVEIVEKLDRLTSLENKMRDGKEVHELDKFDREDIADLLSEYADLLLGIKVEI